MQFWFVCFNDWECASLYGLSMAMGVFKMKEIEPCEVWNRERIFFMSAMYYISIRNIRDLRLNFLFKNIGHVYARMKNRPCLPLVVLCNVHSELMELGQL